MNTAQNVESMTSYVKPDLISISTSIISFNPTSSHHDV